MASWFKAAEDLFEVVDRRAKLVAGEKSDESPNIQPPASNGQGSHAKRTRPKKKTQRRISSTETPTTADTEREQTNQEFPGTEVGSDQDKTVSLTTNDETSSANLKSKYSNLEKPSIDPDSSILEASVTEKISDDDGKHDADPEAGPAIIDNSDATLLDVNLELTTENISSAAEGTDSLSTRSAEAVYDDPSNNSSQNTSVGVTESLKDTNHEETQSPGTNALAKADTKSKDASEFEANHDQNKHPDHKDVTSPQKVQEQLEEAQGLLKTTSSSGQSKEARLARVCAGLSSRLQEFKSESAQLEELLIAERELSKSYEVRIKELQKDLSVAKKDVTRVESNMADALAAKNAEIEALVSTVDALKKQAALSEGNLASLQANMESIMRNRELTETRMMQALREELAAAERRADEERTAHNATKMAAMEREVELEHRAMDASTALARIQRVADERTTKAADLEQKVALLEVECASLNQELQDMETRARRGQKKSPEETNQAIQMQAWQEEVERARQSQREAESKLSFMEAEMQKLRVEMAAMKRDAEHYSRQEHMELEKRYRELTELLYYKQTQLEAMASEKAAAEFQLEKEVKRLHEAQVEAEKSRVSRRASYSSWEEDSDMKALEPLPLHNRHLVGAGMQLQKAAKILDSGAVKATRFLWRYPRARVCLLLYLVFVHFFLMYLLHRLQEQADTFAAREVAESMGLANQTLP